ncbi:hypothetical protein [Flavobacterium sp.]|uniref:hypothetical protein n=1 Tax=Flavobacterium sp. TaxID=239 RepID=UPI003D12A66F
MEATKTAHIQFDEINISFLKSVVSIFQSKSKESIVTENRLSQLKHHFGLPLSVASFENRVIGYAFVAINKNGETEINSYWEKDFYSIEGEQDLKFYAENSFHTTFKDPETRTSKIQSATERLVNWLHLCE